VTEPIEELRLLTRLDRSRLAALGAVLSAAGIVIGCREAPPVAVYGAPASPADAPSAAPAEAPSSSSGAPGAAPSSIVPSAATGLPVSIYGAPAPTVSVPRR